ncbi:MULTISPECIES: hypothetical protein [Pseudonocardia]|uniref:Uncharacterized protein n=2 Tax=Pseudonocardia TaxID=1847 RepID=A0A1Y2N651_PSEAH|nr:MULTISPECIES: hypothetical protein [Pseudonocardia]OSY42942.1 hypothetical protein BG845_01184 [Pseudonocardia autotrophica]TDN77518.1 hypothetical protein C8E95_6766 [Pseudonocardia autotrophica]BBG01543.1 hypothetical protein Pdca_27520 [Pseudonocardia autotrophica]GEC25327.1 hypothetical protein PSA01_23560 [Pseudonocardia saturnea]
MNDSLTIEEISEHLTAHGRELLEQAVQAAIKVKQLRNELAAARNANQATD